MAGGINIPGLPLGVKTGSTGESDVILAWAVELVGLSAVVLVAGMSDEAGSAMLVVIIGLALLWSMSHLSDLQAIPNIFTYLHSKGLA